MAIDQTLPPPSNQKELLNNMILALTEEEFEARMLTSARGRGTVLSNNLGVAGSGNDEARF